MSTILFELARFCLFCVFVLGAGIFLYWMLGGLTTVKEGTAKIVVRFGKYQKTLLAKRGYKVTEDGQIVPLAQGEKEEQLLPGGLRAVGIPFVDKVFKKDQKWVKSLPDGKLEDRTESNVDFILAFVDYQYGLRFKDAEDSNLLPLSGQMTLTAKIINPYKAHFAVKDWFDAMVTRVLPRVREYISLHPYEDIINRKNVQLDRDVFKKLNEPGGPDKDGNPSPSIVEELKEKYGVVLVALETVNIDPPEDYRKATLQKWQAERDVQRDTKKRAGSTIGALVEGIANLVGKDAKVIKKEFQDDLEGTMKKYAPIVAMNEKFILRQMGLDANAVSQFAFEGASGTEASLMKLLAVAGKSFRGTSGGSSGSGGNAGSSSKKKGEKYTTEDMEKLIDDLEKGE